MDRIEFAKSRSRQSGRTSSKKTASFSSQNSFKCCHTKPYHYCLNTDCIQNNLAISCDKGDCQCQDFHEYFQKANFKNAVEEIKTKIIQIVNENKFEIKNKILQIFNKLEKAKSCIYQKNVIENLEREGFDNLINKQMLVTQLDSLKILQESIQTQLKQFSCNLDIFFRKIQEKKSLLDKNSSLPVIVNENLSFIGSNPQKSDSLPLKKDEGQNIIQEQLTLEEQQKYNNHPILKTILRNVYLDYESQYTKENLMNILNIYQNAYQYESQYKRKSVYDKEKSKFQVFGQSVSEKFKRQLEILKWLQNIRGKKFNGISLISAKIKTQRSQYKQPKLCIFSFDLFYCQPKSTSKPEQYQRIPRLKTAKIILNMQLNTKSGTFYVKPVSVKNYNRKKLIIQYLLQRQKKSQKSGERIQLRLIKLRNDKQIATPWVVQIIDDGRYVWRADNYIDKIDVKNLLKFILSKNEYFKQSPSVLINAGTHGDYQGEGANQNNDHTLVDYNIVRDMQEMIQLLLTQIKQKKFQSLLTEDNVSSKICINQVNLQRRSSYPVTANHIIDTLCNGAYSVVKKQDIDCFTGHSVNDLTFLHTLKKQQSSIFWHSAVIKTFQTQKNLINLFQAKNYKLSAELIYRASIYDFNIHKFYEKCGTQINTLIIGRTNKKKIIGGFSPVSHMHKQQSQYMNQDYIQQKENSKKNPAFIFTLSNPKSDQQKFTLIAKTNAIIKLPSNDAIKFGNQELVICNEANFLGNCQSKINNGVYYNQNYKNYEDQQSCIKFHGNQSTYFALQQWEVWKINFQQNYLVKLPPKNPHYQNSRPIKIQQPKRYKKQSDFQKSFKNITPPKNQNQSNNSIKSKYTNDFVQSKDVTPKSSKSKIINNPKSQFNTADYNEPQQNPAKINENIYRSRRLIKEQRRYSEVSGEKQIKKQQHNHRFEESRIYLNSFKVQQSIK